MTSPPPPPTAPAADSARPRPSRAAAERRRSRRRRFAAAFATVALGLFAAADRAAAQDFQDVGRFRIVFWNQVDGDHNFGAESIVQADLGTFSAEERAAVVQSFQYWNGILNTTTDAGAGGTVGAVGEQVVIRVLKDDSQTGYNANAASSLHDVGGGVISTDTAARLVNGQSTTRTDGQDGRIVFEFGASPLNFDRPAQLVPPGNSVVRTSIHEIGHLLGFTGDHDPFSTNTVGGNFNGTEVDAITGAAGVPVDGDGAHTLLDYHNLTRAEPTGVSYRNLAAFGPAELAVLADLGYDAGANATLNLDQQFGGARYFADVAGAVGFNDNVAGGTGTTGTWTSAADYSVGYFLQTDGSVVRLVGSTNQSGFATAGVRIAGPGNQTTGDRVTLDVGSAINASGDSAVGVLVSSGANNWITHRGAINLTGADTIGLQFDFGGPFGTTVVDSGRYGDHLVDRVDLTGTVSADRSIFIADTAAVREINVLTGASLTGDIVSDAFVGALGRPTLTFGRAFDAGTGQANGVTGTAGAGGDAAFVFTFADDVTSSDPGVNGGRAVLDAQVYGGATTLSGIALFGGEYEQYGGTLTASGTLLNYNGTTLHGGELLVSGNGFLEGTEVRNGATLTVSGTARTGDDVTSTDAFYDLEVQAGGTAAVTATGTLVTDDFDTAGTATVADGGTFNAATADVTGAGDWTVNGTAAVTGAATVDAGELTVGATGAFDAASLALSGSGDATTSGDVDVVGATTVDGAGSTLNVAAGAFDADSLALTDNAAASVTGTATLTGAATVTDSTATVNAGGTLAAGSATLNSGLLDVLAGGTADVTGDALLDGGFARVNGDLLAANVLLNQGGAIGGAGTVTGDFFAAGRIAPGNSPGVLTVVGNFTGASVAVYDIELQAAAAPVAGVDYDRLAVNGAASVDGGTVNVLPFGNSNYVFGSRYDFLTAAGGLTVQNRVDVVDPLADVRFAQLIGPNSYALVTARDVPFATFGDTFNTRQVGAALDRVRNDPALAELRDALDTLPADADVRDAINQLSGEIYGTQLTAMNRSNLQFLDVVGSRGGAFPLVCGTCGAGPGRGGLQGWQETFGAGGQVEGDGNAFEAQLGTAGTAVGLSRIYGGESGCLAVDVFYGYESTTVRVPDARSTLTDESHRVGGSLRASAGRVYGRLTGFSGGFDGESRRAFVVDNPLFPLSNQTRGEYDGSLSAGDAEVGALTGSEVAYLMPIAGVRVVRTHRGGFAEDGGISALAVDDAALTELRARVGLRAGRRLALGWNLPATGTFEAFYSRDLSASSVGDFRANLVAAEAARFTARGTDFDADRLVLGPGLTLGDGPVQLTGRYRAGLSETAVLHAGDVGLEVCF
ncbi:autotransporter domain-containing protein [Alienimonas californiensis]|uniref:Autotransporter beta-domain protein n=1 Tax=Alienimonas californiensis TaxID=2527989 RepID=A0A517P775_9PLAN|nr:autotransporter domain-containing protein [Alienimonas californiensis]QDT15239.1 Autotransporter beta-domain protein [Alienimonas californiensis]